MTDHDTADLLLFTTGEMPPQRQDQFADRLAQEPQLAAALVELQSLNSRTRDWFAHGERHEHPALMEAHRSAAVRRVSRGIVQKRLEDSARAASMPRQPFKLPGWIYSVAAVAVLIIAFVVLVQWGNGLQSTQQANDEMPFRSREFRNDVFPMVENDFDTLSLSASNYETSSMWPDDASGSTGNGL